MDKGQKIKSQKIKKQPVIVKLVGRELVVDFADKSKVSQKIESVVMRQALRKLGF